MKKWPKLRCPSNHPKITLFTLWLLNYPFIWGGSKRRRDRSQKWLEYDIGLHNQLTWHRQTTSAVVANKSTTLPLPSSPHWAPKITVTLPSWLSVRCFFLGDPLPFIFVKLNLSRLGTRFWRWDLQLSTKN